MMAKNGPSRGIKGAWRRFMKAKIGPVPAPVVVIGAIAAIYLWHKRSQAAAAGGASASSGDPFAGPDTSGGAAGSGSSGGGSSGGIGGIIGPPVNQVIRRRVTVNRRVFVTKLPNGSRRVRRPDRPNAPHRTGAGTGGNGRLPGGDRHGPPVTFRGRQGGRIPHVPINTVPALKGH
jgi:hypothetical protein